MDSIGSTSMGVESGQPISLLSIANPFLPHTTNLLVVGNSLCNPTEPGFESYYGVAENHFVHQLAAMTGWHVRSFAGGGMSTGALLEDDGKIDAHFDIRARENWIVFWEGFKSINDDKLSAAESCRLIQTFVSHRKRFDTHWKVAVCTVIACDSPLVHVGWNAERTLLNSYLRQCSGFDALIDLAADPRFATVIPEWFAADKMHLNKSGNNAVAMLVRDAILGRTAVEQ